MHILSNYFPNVATHIIAKMVGFKLSQRKTWLPLKPLREGDLSNDIMLLEWLFQSESSCKYI